MPEMHSSSLFDDPGTRQPETLSKKGFAELIGVTPGRISQLINTGLPVEPNGRIHIARGKQWIAANVDSNRRRATLTEPALTPALISPRVKRDAHEAEIARLKAEKMGRQLIDRRTTLRVIESRSRAERDAWIGWSNRAAPLLAAETGGDLAVIAALLDKLVREQLITLADRPLPEIIND